MKHTVWRNAASQSNQTASVALSEQTIQNARGKNQDIPYQA